MESRVSEQRHSGKNPHPSSLRPHPCFSTFHPSTFHVKKGFSYGNRKRSRRRGSSRDLAQGDDVGGQVRAGKHRRGGAELWPLQRTGREQGRVRRGAGVGQ